MNYFEKYLNAQLQPGMHEGCHWGFKRGSNRRHNPGNHRAVAALAQEGRVIACLFYEHEALTMPFAHFVDSVKLFHPQLSSCTIMHPDQGTIEDLRGGGINAQVQEAGFVEAELVVPESATRAKLEPWEPLLSATARTALAAEPGVAYV